MKTTGERKLDEHLFQIGKHLSILREELPEPIFYALVKQKFDFSLVFAMELIENYYETLIVSQ